MIAVCTPDFFAAVPRLWAGKRDPGVCRRAAAVRHDAHRADPGQPFPGLRRGGDQAGQRHHGRARRTRRRLHRGASPVGPPGGPPSCFAAPGEASRVESPRPCASWTRCRTTTCFWVCLAGLFPRAKFIHCRRDLRDVAVSCWMTHFREIRWANDQQHIASRFQEYQRLMEHWREVLPVPLLDVDYEETVADLEGVARRLVAWCGWNGSRLPGVPPTKRPVRTAGAVRSASRSIRNRSADGSTTNKLWQRSWRRFPADRIERRGQLRLRRFLREQGIGRFQNMAGDYHLTLSFAAEI